MALKLVPACWLFACVVHLAGGIETQFDKIRANVSQKDGEKPVFHINLMLRKARDTSRSAYHPNAYNRYTKEASLYSVEPGIPIEEHPSWKLLEEPCGESLSDRIIGGKNAALGQYPWIARLGRFKFFKGHRGNVDWYCAGSIINRLYILTAAHCVREPNLKVVRLGEYDTNTALDCDMYGCADPPQDMAPIHIVSHPHFVMISSITPNDIALIRLEKQIYFNDWVSPICLPRFNSPSLYKGVAESIGWGLTIPMMISYPAVLQRVSLPITPTRKCIAEFHGVVDEGTFCAGGKKNKDSCNGDSGGPLLKADDGDGFPKYYIIGVVSFGPSNCGNGELGGYTNVSYHLRWVLNNLRP